ncbi:hypothetical protein WJX74_008094 [Apatococcus lobatus]|uniref:Uncharacterized protein n=1 Tax=Apatococcus lobatus TaxID=904363 RepID=A0AAW1Q327_9CHLO
MITYARKRRAAEHAPFSELKVAEKLQPAVAERTNSTANKTKQLKPDPQTIESRRQHAQEAGVASRSTTRTAKGGAPIECGPLTLTSTSLQEAQAAGEMYKHSAPFQHAAAAYKITAPQQALSLKQPSALVV